jgi:hypothetical protein
MPHHSQQSHEQVWMAGGAVRKPIPQPRGKDTGLNLKTSDIAGAQPRKILRIIKRPGYFQVSPSKASIDNVCKPNQTNPLSVS